MVKLTPTLDILLAIIERVPEGFLHVNVFRRYLRVNGKKNIPAFDNAVAQGILGKSGQYLYDPRRIDADEVKQRGAWSSPEFPALTEDGVLKDRPISERWAEREAQLAQADAPEYVRLVRAVQDTQGYILLESLLENPGDSAKLNDLVAVDVLARLDDLIYDPLRIGTQTAQTVIRKHRQQAMIDRMNAHLASLPGQTASREALEKEFGADVIQQILALNVLSVFHVKTKIEPFQVMWFKPKGADINVAKAVAQEAVKIPDEAWQASLDLAGDVKRVDAKEAGSIRAQVVAHSYTVKRAAKRLALSSESITQAIEDGVLHHFVDPENKIRVPAVQIENAIEDEAFYERLAGYERVSVRDLAVTEGVSFSTIRRRLKRMGIHHAKPAWSDIRGRWSLPDTYPGYIEKRDRMLEERRRERAERIAHENRLLEEQLEAERQEREALRERLLSAFPAWKHSGRADQHISIHIGPPNSGKTHQSLEALVAAGSGWYLAPLRLLAFEIFDRLNQRGIPCNLLTGEEYVPVADAQITAATIEMFNPFDSGDCIIIDEAQMLADTDRGWAWTRAMMEAQAPEIHIIGPSTARDLIVKLSTEAGFPHTVIPHERLAPIKVADKAWPLETLQPRTILVAFSRRMVLHLKTELEQLKRTVSVVYGALPPEVRRKQADRFANGETEICVATDAVGMGLNLPADYVCFYEVEKYDGEKVRELNTSEVQQIGGRAGRYGFSQAGEVGAIYRRDLKLIEQLFNAEPTVLTHANVAPTVEDLSMIPGHLADRLRQWSALDSIPEALRGVIKTTDLDERIELASMLSEEDVAQLGLDAAVRLINAPTRQSSRAYWLSCAKAIIRQRPMPLPPTAPRQILTSRDLETTESAISCADIYLWLGSRREFEAFGGDEIEVRAARQYWSTQIDEALLRKIDTARRCVQCGRRLPRDYRYSVCERCFYGDYHPH